jgi:2-desacetyl-2-hydroxyethyl bacteriochlorophyllide A dehydrogenase
MRAARITAKETVELVDLEAVEPGQGEALLRVVECGICGSDLHAYHGRWEGDRPGHEFCAVVEAVGPGVQALRPGARVTGECFAHCGRCAACRRGEYNHCESIAWSPGRPAGALAERVVYPVGSLLAVPDALSDRQAALVEPLAVAFRAVARGGVGEGTTVAVIGAGTIGLLCAAVARARGASRVISIAKYPHQARKASEVGATDVHTVSQGDPRQAVRAATGGRGAGVVVDSVAAGTSFGTALSLAASHGCVVEVGGATKPLLSALNPLVDNELRVVGSICYAVTDGRRDFEWAMDLIASGRAPVESVVTHTFPLDQAAEAFRTAADKKTGAIKVVVTME